MQLTSHFDANHQVPCLASAGVVCKISTKTRKDRSSIQFYYCLQTNLASSDVMENTFIKVRIHLDLILHSIWMIRIIKQSAVASHFEKHRK